MYLISRRTRVYYIGPSTVCTSSFHELERVLQRQQNVPMKPKGTTQDIMTPWYLPSTEFYAPRNLPWTPSLPHHAHLLTDVLEAVRDILEIHNFHRDVYSPRRTESFPYRSKCAFPDYFVKLVTIRSCGPRHPLPPYPSFTHIFRRTTTYSWHGWKQDAKVGRRKKQPKKGQQGKNLASNNSPDVLTTLCAKKVCRRTSSKPGTNESMTSFAVLWSASDDIRSRHRPFSRFWNHSPFWLWPKVYKHARQICVMAAGH